MKVQRRRSMTPYKREVQRRWCGDCGASRDGTKEYVRTREKRTFSPGHDREQKNLEAVVMDIIEISSLQPWVQLLLKKIIL